jgi:Protein of unknown function (DUF4035)
MPASLFKEWQEYEKLEPFGAWRDNFHAAMMCALIANANRDPKRPPVKIGDFFYVDPETEKESNDERMLESLRSRKGRKRGKRNG